MKENNEWWIFTFGYGHTYAGYYVKIKGTYAEARRKMCEKYGIKWAFQYSVDEWEKTYEDPNRDYPLEEEPEVIE